MLRTIRGGRFVGDKSGGTKKKVALVVGGSGTNKNRDWTGRNLFGDGKASG
jgi:hypothetical protein